MTLQRTIIGIMCLLLTHCGVDQRAVPELERDLKRTKVQQGVLLNLAELTLESHEDIDHFETNVLGKMPLLRAIDVYASLTDDKRAGKPRTDALLLSRFSIFILDGLRQVSDQETRTALIKQSQELSKRVQTSYPDDPNTLYSVGYTVLRLFQIFGSQRQNDDFRQQVRRQIESSWNKLLKIAPDFQGPEGFDAARIKKELAGLQTVSQEGGSDTRGDGLLEPVASENLALARESLWTLENKPQQAAAICRDYEKAIRGEPGLALPASLAEAEIGLTCGLSLGNRRLALLGLGQLVLRSPKTDICSALQSIRCRSESVLCDTFKTRLGRIGADQRENTCISAVHFAAQTLVVSRTLRLAKLQAGLEPSAETSSVDTVEEGQRLRRRAGPDGTVIAQAVARRGQNIEGFPTAKRLHVALRAVLTSEASRQEFASLVGLVLGDVEAVDATLTSRSFDGSQGYLLELRRIRSRNGRSLLDASFFLTPPTTENQWQVEAVSVAVNLKDDSEIKRWLEPAFPPPAVPSQDVPDERASPPDESGSEPTSPREPTPPEQNTVKPAAGKPSPDAGTDAQ